MTVRKYRKANHIDIANKQTPILVDFLAVQGASVWQMSVRPDPGGRRMGREGDWAT